MQWVKPGEREIPKDLQQHSDALLDEKNEENEDNFELPGFDLDLALNRMGGNLKAYKKTLAKVVDAESDVIERIKKHLELGEKEDAIRAAHTIKGVFGNLGENKVMAIAGKLEHLLQQEIINPSESNVLIKEMDDCLNDAISRITKALANSTAEKNEASFDINLPEKLSAIQQSIEDFDSTAEDLVGELIEQIGQNEPLVSSLQQLQVQLGSYDFDTALNQISEIIKNNP